MYTTARHGLRHSLIVAAAALLAACADGAPLGPNQRTVLPSQIRSGASTDRVANVTGCDNLQAPAGSKLAFHAYAEGVQIYRWNGTSWVFVAPSAKLFAHAGGESALGIHYAGPTWESASGSKVVGTVLARCTPAADAIPWLLLSAVSTEGPGIFHRVALIQRVNTVGGTAPVAAGRFTGEEIGVPYAAEYFFFR